MSSFPRLIDERTNTHECECAKCKCTFISKWGTYPMCFSCFKEWDDVRWDPEEKSKFWKSKEDENDSLFLSDSDDE